MNNIKQFTFRDGLLKPSIMKTIEYKDKTIQVPYVIGATGRIIKLGYEVDDAGIGYPIFIDNEPFYVNNYTGVYEVQNEDNIDFIVKEILVPQNFTYTLTYVLEE